MTGNDRDIFIIDFNPKEFPYHTEMLRLIAKHFAIDHFNFYGNCDKIDVIWKCNPNAIGYFNCYKSFDAIWVLKESVVLDVES